MKKIFLVFSLIPLALLSGCSTLTAEGTGQTITVLSYEKSNKDLNGAKCELSNDEGTWSLTTPGSAMVQLWFIDLIKI